MTDSNSCKGIDSVEVNVNPLPTASAGSPVSICIGKSVTITASGGNSYFWDDNSVNQNRTVSPMVTNNYFVTVTDGNGCEDSASVLVTVNAIPIAAASVDTSICKLDTATLLASGGTSYVWSDGTGSYTSNPYKVSPTNTTRYFVTVTDGNNCEDTASVTVTINALPEPNVGPVSTLCVGDSIKIGAKLGGSYLWSTNAISDSIVVSPSQNTFYRVTMTDGSSCKGIDSVEVKVNPLPTASAGVDDSICIGSSKTLTASVGSRYLWDNADTTQSRTVTPVELEFDQVEKC